MKTSLLLSLLIVSLPTFAADPAIEKAVANPQRTADDRERDARDKPAEIIEALRKFLAVPARGEAALSGPSPAA